ncbi:hypothetical protein GQR58_028986 [Nymphon striatum]|nr:hypothetical protein GQR58_028986 [Nymphon striatum]
MLDDRGHFRAGGFLVIVCGCRVRRFRIIYLGSYCRIVAGVFLAAVYLQGSGRRFRCDAGRCIWPRSIKHIFSGSHGRGRKPAPSSDAGTTGAASSGGGSAAGASGAGAASAAAASAATTTAAPLMAAEVKPSTALAGEAELASRKGEWKYEAPAAAKKPAAKKPAAKKAAPKKAAAKAATADKPATKTAAAKKAAPKKAAAADKPAAKAATAKKTTAKTAAADKPAAKKAAPRRQRRNPQTPSQRPKTLRRSQQMVQPQIFDSAPAGGAD